MTYNIASNAMATFREVIYSGEKIDEIRGKSSIQIPNVAFK